MTDRIIQKWLWFLLVTASFLAIGSLRAAQEQYSDGKDYSKQIAPVPQSWCETPPLWEVRIGVPGWMAGLSGDAGVKGVDSNADVSFDQILTHLTHFPIAFLADVRYQRWEIFGD